MAILVGYVPSAQGTQTLSAGAAEARRRKEGLSIVLSRTCSPGWAADDDDDVRQLLSDESLDARVHLRDETSIGDSVLAQADEEAASMIVIGFRRRPPLGKMILGASAQRVLVEANCPVLAIHTGG